VDTKVIHKDGRVGDILGYTQFKRAVVRFYDGLHADPTDPMFPLYEEIVDPDDLQASRGDEPAQPPAGDVR
jgi:hypothetical protein